MLQSKPLGDILFLAHRFPHPPDKGDRIRSFHLLRWLADRARVRLATLAHEPFDPKSAEVLGDLCAAVSIHQTSPWTRRARSAWSLARGRSATEGAFQSASLARTIDDWAGRIPFDLAIASSSGMVPHLRRASLRNVPALVDLVDVDSQKWLDYANHCRGPARWLYRLEGARLRRVEREVPSWALGALLVSRTERDLFGSFQDATGVHVIENGVDLEALTPREGAVEEPGSCVFVGALDYRPNVDAICWFCREVWPEVLRRRGDARLRVVGHHPTAAVRELGSIPGVEILGRVPDVRPHLERAGVVVVPLRIARGIQNKVLEGLAMGKAVLASPEALKGFRPDLEVPVRPASAAGEWVEGLLELFDDVEERRRLGRAGRAFVTAHHRWDRCLEPLAEILGGPAAAAQS